MAKKMTYEEVNKLYREKFSEAVEFFAQESARMFYEHFGDTNLYVEDLEIYRKHYYQPMKEHGIIKRIGKVEKRCFDVIFIRAWKEEMESISEGDVA